MALVDSHRAIGAVTRLLIDHLTRLGFETSVGKPEAAALVNTAAKLNLFLFEIDFDASLRNVQLDPERPSPIWLSLRYLLTAFDANEISDSAAAQELLGQGIAALHQLNFLTLDDAVDAAIRSALENSPEALKITFDSARAEALSRIMQGGSESYRLSAALEVRPVMIVPAELPGYERLVGVDYTRTPVVEIGADGVDIEVFPSLGPRLSHLEPARFAPGDVIEVHGADLHLGGMFCTLDGVELRVQGQRADRLTVQIEGPPPAPGAQGPIAAGAAISPGEHALQARLLLQNGRFRGSNMLVGALRPVVTGASLSGAGDLTVTGLLLGTDSDDVLVAFHADGEVAALVDSPTTAADQQSLSVAQTALAAAGVSLGLYLVIVRVNGQQAALSPQLRVG